VCVLPHQGIPAKNEALTLLYKMYLRWFAEMPEFTKENAFDWRLKNMPCKTKV
jgi:hypothetical protein